MASARVLSKLVSTAASVSSGAVAAIEESRRTGDQVAALRFISELLEFLAHSLASTPQPDEESIADVRSSLESMILHYGTMRRSIDALADRRRKHELISVDKARAWSHAMAASPAVVESTLKHHATLHMQVIRWANTVGTALDSQLAEYQDWLDGPIQSAGAAIAPRATNRPDGRAHAEEQLVDSDPGGERSTELSAALKLVQDDALDDKHVSEHHHERWLSAEIQAAADLLRDSREPIDRCVASIATGDFAAADAALNQLRGRIPVVHHKSLTGDRCFYEGRFDDAIPLYREARAIADTSQAKLNLAAALMHAHRGMHEEHYKEAIDLLSSIRATEPEGSKLWIRATCLSGAANLYCPSGDRDLNVRRAVERLESVLSHLDQHKDRMWWAEAHLQLGVAWQQLPTGKKVENVQRAITCFNRAAENWTRDVSPDRWATIQNNLGHAWEALPTGLRAVNLQRAIDYFTSALSVRDPQRHPVSWATIQNNLGNAWAKMPAGELRENVQRAIDCHSAALSVWSAEDRRHEWAATQNNLGNAWALLPAADEDERQRNLRRSISCYKSALQVRTRATAPTEWASTQNNLGSALLMTPGDFSDQNVHEAIACFKSALEVRTRDCLPLDWAKTQTNLGSAFLRLRKGNRADHVKSAIKSFENALEVFRPELYPHQHDYVASKLREARDGAVQHGG